MNDHRALDVFEPFRAVIMTIHGAELYAGLRRSEFFIFCDEDEWFIAYLPSASVLPSCFIRAIDAARAVNDIARLRNDWTDVSSAGFRRHLNDLLIIAQKHGGRQWRTLYNSQPVLRLDFNGYGANAA